MHITQPVLERVPLDVPGCGPVNVRDRIHWHLDQAERLDKQAADLPPKPAAVASIYDMTDTWTDATLGPELLRQTADYHRGRAVHLTRTLNERTRR